MVFSSAPLYLDPPNWNQQGSSNIVYDEGDNIHQLPQPGATSSAPAPHQVATGGSAARPGPGGSMVERARLAKIPQADAALKCPRCDSTNTKFCYFNNYSLTQPRHFCKTCRRYWTRGGALRSVPVGGGCRRNKRGNKPSSSKSSTPGSVAPSTSSGASAGAFRTVPPPFLAPWNHLPDYGFAGIQHPINETTESMGLEQWRIQQIHQFPFLGGLAEPSVPVATMVPGLYPFEGELVGGHGKIMPTIKMEESSQSAAATTAAAVNLPRQFFNMGRNDGQIWPSGGDGSGGAEGHGGRWISGEHLSGFNSSSTGNLL